ncbi:putative F-box domain-containing protein [Rosa chinensis]|uniref:Putative F-box domain-containing protein n=1 Tax=Rosa chinensis TaxID=74649 RepID=A0A2P6RC97_ROSCH|nr:probable F-box protein At2g36090 [Rosa chinensis]PRQ44041.1 putative F-box domain-containing protein [Rosa chinensis]
MARFSHQPPSTTVDEDSSASISAVHPDIIQTHILTRLDGPTLASAACTSFQLHSLASDHRIWANICHSTWPSTTTPRLRQVISTFPDGAFSFFSDSFPLLANLDSAAAAADHHDSPTELISAVDIYHGDKLIFSKVVETETVSGWFTCSPFRIDLLDPKDVVPTPVKYPVGQEADTCRYLGEELRLSWILIDPVGRRAMNLSSHTAVSVQRHWLSGEVHARFASILPGQRGTASEFVQCGIVVTCGAGSEGGELQVREVSLQVEDMDGMHLNGKDGLVILQRGLEGRKGRNGRRGEEGRRRYGDYLERKRERKEKKKRTEGTLDTLCVTFGVLGFFLFWLFILCR